MLHAGSLLRPARPPRNCTPTGDHVVYLIVIVPFMPLSARSGTDQCISPGRTVWNCTWIVPSASNSSQAGAPFMWTSRSSMTIWFIQTLRNRSVCELVFEAARRRDLPAVALAGDQLEILLVDGELVFLRAEDQFREVLAGARHLGLVVIVVGVPAPAAVRIVARARPTEGSECDDASILRS